MATTAPGMRPVGDVLLQHLADAGEPRRRDPQRVGARAGQGSGRRRGARRPSRRRQHRQRQRQRGHHRCRYSRMAAAAAGTAQAGLRQPKMS